MLLLLEMGELQAALEAIDRVIALEDQDSWNHGMRGEVLLFLGGPHRKESLRSFQRASELDPSSLDWLRGQADALHALRRPSAREVYEEVIRLARSEAEVDEDRKGTLAWALYRHGDADEATRVFRQMVAAGGGTPITQFNLALTFLSSGRTETALVEYERAVTGAQRNDDRRRYGLFLEALADLKDGIDSRLVPDKDAARQALQELSTQIERLGDWDFASPRRASNKGSK